MSTNECLICGKDCVAEVHKDTEGKDFTEIGEAVVFSATGNWASSVWDPLEDDLLLYIYICDDCLRPHMDRTEVARIRRSCVELERAPYTQWLADRRRADHYEQVAKQNRRYKK